MNSFVKFVLSVAALLTFVYFVVDDKTRQGFDNGWEAQMITMTEVKNSTYLFLWEFFGAHEDELEREAAIYKKDIALRRKLLKEKEDTRLQRVPAYDDPNKLERRFGK